MGTNNSSTHWFVSSILIAISSIAMMQLIGEHKLCICESGDIHSISNWQHMVHFAHNMYSLKKWNLLSILKCHVLFVCWCTTNGKDNAEFKQEAWKMFYNTFTVIMWKKVQFEKCQKRDMGSMNGCYRKGRFGLKFRTLQYLQLSENVAGCFKSQLGPCHLDKYSIGNQNDHLSGCQTRNSGTRFKQRSQLLNQQVMEKEYSF